MSGPLAGIGQQQIPLSQPYQPGGSDQSKVARQEEQKPERGEVQVRGASLGNTQESNTNSQKQHVAQDDQNILSASNDSGDKPRGSLVNIVV